MCPGEPKDIRVSVELLNPGKAMVKDPTNDAIVVPGLIHQDTIVMSEDGCWCTCPLFPNSSSVGDALTPNTTAYRVTVFHGSKLVVDETFALNAEEAALLPLDDNADCGECINICTLVPTLELPPPPTFCEAVEACVAEDLAVLEAADADLQAQIDAIPPDTNTTNADIALAADPATGLTVTLVDSDGNSVNSTLPIADFCALVDECLPRVASTCLTDPATGAAVIGSVVDGVASFTYPDGSAFAGDPNTLI